MPALFKSKKTNSTILLTSCLLLFIFNNSGFAQNLMNGPLIKNQNISKSQDITESTIKLIGIGAIELYSKYISPADGARSPSYPTSTVYGKQAIEQYGFFLGIILTADRLIHQADVHYGAQMATYGLARYYDPLSENTFWWDK
jgi:putative component of membrane protein insertase Oxa1/YidC/SpoIIIJ protein YidD